MSDRTDYLLKRRGLKRISDKKYSATGIDHKFDAEFIEALDLYLSGVATNLMTKSQLNNIKLFIDFADGKIEETHQDYNSLVEFDKYLTTYTI